MSYSNSMEYYAFDGMFFNLDAENNQIKRKKQEEIESFLKEKEKIKLSKILNRFNNNHDVVFYVYKYLLTEQLDYSIKRYVKYETLPAEYCSLIKQINAIQILVINYLSNHHDIKLSKNEVLDLEMLVELLISNDSGEAAYYRVSQLRNFITNKISQCLDKNQDISASFIRPLLSACRLHFLIRDFKSNNFNYQLSQKCLNEQLYEYEMSKDLEIAKLKNGKKYYARWKARHFHTLDYYTNSQIRRKLSQIFKIDKQLTTKQYIYELIAIVI